MSFTFERFHAEHPGLDGPAAKAAFETLPEHLQEQAWKHLREEMDRKHRRSKTDWHAIDERLREIEAPVYIERLAHIEVAPHQFVACPLPQHEDDTPSFRVYPDRKWHCFGCNRTGTIYEFAGYLWDLPTRGEGFKQIQRQLAARFL